MTLPVLPSPLLDFGILHVSHVSFSVTSQICTSYIKLLSAKCTATFRISCHFLQLLRMMRLHLVSPRQSSSYALLPRLYLGHRKMARMMWTNSERNEIMCNRRITFVELVKISEACCKSTTVAFGRISKKRRWNCREIAAMTGNIVFKALLKLMWNHCCKQLQATRLAEKHETIQMFEPLGKKLLGRHACRADTFAREPARGGKQH